MTIAVFWMEEAGHERYRAEAQALARNQQPQVGAVFLNFTRDFSESVCSPHSHLFKALFGCRAGSWRKTVKEIQLFPWVFPLRAKDGSRAPHRDTFVARL